MARFPRPDWPEVGGEYWTSLRSKFDHLKVTEGEAEAASERLFLGPPKLVELYPRALLDSIRDERKEQAAEAVRSRPDPSARHTADVNPRADAHWASIAEGERDRYRAIVGRHFPWGKGHFINESIAKYMAIVPGYVDELTPPDEVPDWGPGHVLGERKRRERKANEELGRALRFLVSALAVKPTPLGWLLSCANEVEISDVAIHEAAKKLNVIKTIGGGGGEEVWDLDQGGKR